MSAKENDKKEDKELDDLLNSALEDFEKSDKNDKTNEESEPKSQDTVLTEEFSEEFITIQAKLFEEKMAALFGSGNSNEPPSADQISMGFQRMAEAAAMALQPDTENVADPQFTQSITDALRGLSEGAENLQNPFSPDDIAEMFGSVDLNEAGDNNAFLPFMQGMMQSLLSAEVLLPSLKDLVEKYPQYLQENGDKIDVADKERYIKQQQLMSTVCNELEKERPDDSSEVKKERFHKVFEAMQKMQELGQPPAELVGDVGATNIPTLDPSIMSDPSQCLIM